MNLRTAYTYFALLCLGALVSVPVMRRATSELIDFRDHIQMAEDFPETVTHVTHALFHGTYRFVAAVALGDTAPSRSAMIAILVFMTPLPLILFWLLKRAAAGSLSDWLLGALAIGLTIMSPITLGVGANQYMQGYINSVVYHNPTLLALRVFVVPLSLLALRVFDGGEYRNANQQRFILLLTLALMMAATQAKPSYTIVLLPGCVLLALYRKLRGKSVDFALLVFGICAPGLILLLLQYTLSYVNYQDGSQIAFGFLTYLRLQHDDLQVIFGLALSLVFPLGVCWLYRDEARQNLYMGMSRLILALSLVLGYGFYEAGPRAWHGNLMWSSYAAMNALMFASLALVLKRHAIEQRLGVSGWRIRHFRFSRRFAICMLLFGMHVISGCAYWWRFLQGV